MDGEDTGTQSRLGAYLALLGNLHALKKVDWDLEKPSSYVAEILTSLNTR
ncbi:hypothetical protein [Nitrosomonas sp.]